MKALLLLLVIPIILLIIAMPQTEQTEVQQFVNADVITTSEIRGTCIWNPVIDPVCVDGVTYVNHCFVYNRTFTEGVCAGHEEFWE